MLMFICKNLKICVWHSTLVQCSDPGISTFPINLPADTVKLLLEKTLISRVPRAAFYNLSEMRFLWLTHNSITSIHPSSFVNLKALRELRLDGNLLTSFPWEGLRDMPSLQTLGLHNNRLSILPAHASVFLPNITYLDLSSNRCVQTPQNYFVLMRGTTELSNVKQSVDMVWYIWLSIIPFLTTPYISGWLYYLVSCWTFGFLFQDNMKDKYIGEFWVQYALEQWRHIIFWCCLMQLQST